MTCSLLKLAQLDSASEFGTNSAVLYTMASTRLFAPAQFVSLRNACLSQA